MIKTFFLSAIVAATLFIVPSPLRVTLYHKTELMQAAEKGDINTSQKLLKAGINVDETSHVPCETPETSNC